METEDKSNTSHKREGAVQARSIKSKIIISISLFFLFFVVLFIILAVFNKFNNTMYKNVYFEDIDLTGKTLLEVDNIIKDYTTKVYNKSIVIYNGDDVLFEVSSDDLGISLDATNTYLEVAKFARSGNVITDNFQVIKAYMFGKYFKLDVTYNNTKASELVNKILSAIENKVVDDTYSVSQDKLIITKGKSGVDIDRDRIVEDLIHIFAGNSDTRALSYVVETYVREPKELDIDVLYSAIYKQAKDAKIDETKTPPVYIAHEQGVDFDKEALRAELEKEENQAEGKIIEFKLQITEPKVKLGDLKWEDYDDLLGTYTTEFSVASSYANRNTNIKVSADYINDTVVMPGETFSFNKTVGDCGLASRGFKMATVYSGGKVAQGMGGGVCQVSSTLYNAVIYANLEIVQRDNHGYTVSYVDCGRDVTIYYPYTDFKFKNNRNYPIKVVTSYNSAGSITTSIYGTKEDTDYEVEIESYVLTRIPRTTTYINDNTLPVGTKKQEVYGQDGFTSIAYKVLKKDGKVVKKEVLSNDKYSPMNNIVRVGTKQLSVSPYDE